MKRLLGGLLALPLSALAAEPVASTASAVAPVAASSLGGQLTQLVLGLLLVLGLIFALAWVLRRVQQGGARQGQVIELISSRACWQPCTRMCHNRIASASPRRTALSRPVWPALTNKPSACVSWGFGCACRAKKR